MEDEILIYQQIYEEELHYNCRDPVRKATLRQIYVVLSIGYGYFLISYSLAFSGIVIPEMESDVSLDCSTMDLKWMLPALFFGCIFGVQCGHFSYTHGWKAINNLALAVSFVSWLALAGSEECDVVFVSRFVNGICVGTQSLAGLYFMSECISRDQTNYTRVVISVCTTLGYYTIMSMTYFLDWRYIALGGAFGNIIQFLMMARLPNTPYYLYRNYGWEPALSSYQWLCVKSSESFFKFNQMRRLLDQETEIADFRSIRESLRRVLNLRKYNPVKDSLLVYIGREFTGINIYLGLLLPILNDFSQNMELAKTGAYLIFIINMILDYIAASCYGDVSRKLMIQNSKNISIFMFILGKIYLLRVFKIEVDLFIKFILVTMGSVSYLNWYHNGWGLAPNCFLKEATNYLVNIDEVVWIYTGRWIVAFILSTLVVLSYQLVGLFSITIMFITFSFCVNLICLKLNERIPESKQMCYATLQPYYDEANKEN